MRRPRSGRAAAATAVAGLLIIPVAAPAFAAEASGCAGSAVSRDEQGREIDHVTAPGPGGTSDNPFKVDMGGTVAWHGETSSVIRDGTWKVSIGGVPLSGSFANDEGNRTSGGTEVLGERIPGFVAALLEGNLKMEVKADITGSGGTCTASVWIQGAGSPTFSPLWLTGAGFSVGGLLLLLWMFLGTSKVAAAAPGSYPFGPPGPQGPPPGMPPPGPPPPGPPPPGPPPPTPPPGTPPGYYGTGV